MKTIILSIVSYIFFLGLIYAVFHPLGEMIAGAITFLGFLWSFGYLIETIREELFRRKWKMFYGKK